MAKTREVVLKPQTDAYTVLLIISLVAMVVSCILLYVEYAAYPDARPKISPAPAPVVPKDVFPQGVPPVPGAPPPPPTNPPPGG